MYFLLILISLSVLLFEIAHTVYFYLVFLLLLILLVLLILQSRNCKAAAWINKSSCEEHPVDRHSVIIVATTRYLCPQSSSWFSLSHHSLSISALLCWSCVPPSLCGRGGPLSPHLSPWDPQHSPGLPATPLYVSVCLCPAHPRPD